MKDYYYVLLLSVRQKNIFDLLSEKAWKMKEFT